MSRILAWLLPANFMPHGHCYLWRPDVLWLHVSSDGLIAASYYAIPVALAYFVRKRRAVLPYWWVPSLFAMFIFLCGTTHLLNIWTVWNPDYVVDGLLKLATAIASVATAIVVFSSLPHALALRTPIELQREVDERTAALEALNGQLRDEISAHTHTDAALRESEARFRATFENAAVGIAHLTPDGRCIEVNAVCCHILGYAREEIIERCWEDFTLAADRDSDARERHRLLTAAVDSYKAEKRLVHKRGHTVWVRLTLSAMRSPTAAAESLICVIDEITQRKQLEEELRLTIEKLADNDRRKDEFLATLGHELRNPLAPVSNGVQILKLSVSQPAAVTSTLEMMDRQLKHLVRLVDDLLDLSRITRGKASVRMRRLVLQDVLHQALEASWRDGSPGRPRLELNIPAHPVIVQGDTDRLTQVFVNILSNAAKFTPVTGTVTLGLTSTEDQAVVSVRDTGRGIPTDALESIFQMFSQVKPARAGDRGLGIGLALVRQLVQLHHGKIEARSAGVGTGSEFLIQLPLSSSEAISESTAHQRAGDRPRRILVVDDNVEAALSLASLLGALGHVVQEAHDGQSAIDLVPQFDPEVIFMDLAMPGMSGWETARSIRQLAVSRVPKIFALTGFGQESDRLRSSEVGIDRHLVKPISLELLREVLET